MQLIQSLEEIRAYGRRWAALPIKAVRAIPAEEIMNLFVAANRFVPELLQQYARQYDFANYAGASVGWLRRATGWCRDKDNTIKIDFLWVLFADDVAFNSTLLHELCHTEVHDHTIVFWDLFDRKLKQAAIIDRDDNRRKLWLRKPALKNQEGMHLYDTPGDRYVNVSAHKQKAIREKVCYGFSQHREWMVRSEQQYLSGVYRLIYHIDQETDERGRLPQIIKNIFRGNCKLLTTFDYADAIDFFKGKQLVETYVGYGNAGDGVTDVLCEIFAIIRSRPQYVVRERGVCVSAMFVFSANAGSAISLNDVGEVLRGGYFADMQMCCSSILVEDPDLGEGVFCVHLILALAIDGRAGVWQ